MNALRVRRGARADLGAAGARRFPWWRLLPLALLLAPAALAQPIAALRLAHLSPDAPRVDMVIDGDRFFLDVAYGQTTDYATLPAGRHEISVFPHRLPEQPTAPASGSAASGGSGGETEADARPVVHPLEPITIVVDVKEAGYYTVALSGFYEPPPAEGQTGGLSVDVDPNTASVSVVGPRGYSQTFDGDKLLTGLEPGSYTVRVSREGYRTSTYEIDVQAVETATLSVSLQTGEAGAEGAAQEVKPGGEDTRWRKVELHVYPDAFEAPLPGGARIRIVHASPITVTLDASVVPPDDSRAPQALVEGLTFPNAGDYASVPAGSYTLQLRVSGSSNVLVEVPEMTFEAGAVYTLFVVRDPIDNFLRLVPTVDALLAVAR